MNLKNFFAELKRRNVYRAGVGYAAAAWLIIQIATQVFPFFEVPAWSVRLIIVLLAIGFPFALIWAWLFEFTSEGIMRTEDVPIDSSITRATGRKLDFIVIAVLALAVAFLLFDRFRPGRAGKGGSLEKSIAVLPFENFSNEKENAFFADGVQDDLLTNLARIKDLKVISRTSVMRYREREGRNLKEIAQSLGVVNILEGSVRRVADRIAVNVQLIDARTDHHLWAQKYDRTLSDSLGLEGELAMEIAEALRATLTPEEKSLVETKPTENADAWMLYLRGLQYKQNPDVTLQDLRTADELLTQAVQLDPKFALAHAILASTSATIFHFHEPLESWRVKARSEAEIALRLQPNLAEAHHALGLCHYWIEADYDAALRELSRASALAPNDAAAQLISAAVLRRQGKWAEALAGFERAQKLDPQNPNVVRNVLFTNTAMRRWREAAQAAARFRSISPESLVAKIQAGYVAFLGEGDLKALRRELSSVPAGVDPDGIVTSCRWEGAMLERDFAGAAEILAQSPLTEMDYTNGGATPKSFLAGCTALARNEMAEAQKQFAAAAKVFEEAARESPESAERHANLGLCYAFAGRHDEAIREGRRAIELKPETKDATDGVLMSCYLALIYARVGEKELTFTLLERLLHTPGAVDTVCYSITRNDLRFRWEWDTMRDDPRFQQLLAKAE